MTATAPIPAAQPANDTAPAREDLLVGAEAIAEFLGLSTRQVYHLREKKNCPIINLPGLGVTARRSSLSAWLDEYGL